MLDVLEKKENIEALIELNEDLENYFHSTVIPKLFVDANLILKKFTPPAMKAFNLKKTDIDRPIEQIGDNIRYSTLIEDIQKVIAEDKKELIFSQFGRVNKNVEGQVLAFTS